MTICKVICKDSRKEEPQLIKKHFTCCSHTWDRSEVVSMFLFNNYLPWYDLKIVLKRYTKVFCYDVAVLNYGARNWLLL